MTDAGKTETPILRIISVSSDDLRWAGSWLDSNEGLILEGVATLHAELVEYRKASIDNLQRAESAEQSAAQLRSDLQAARSAIRDANSSTDMSAWRLRNYTAISAAREEPK